LVPAGGIEPDQRPKAADLQSAERTTLLNTGMKFEVFQPQRALSLRPRNLKIFHKKMTNPRVRILSGDLPISDFGTD
jgi:hypothetical protein